MKTLLVVGVAAVAVLVGRSAEAQTPLPRAGWVATASSSTSSNDAPSRAIDGLASTRFSTGANQTQGQWFSLDMITPQSFSQLTFDVGVSTSDYPRGYQVFVSNDAVTWGPPVASGTGASGVITVVFPTQTARFVGIVQTGSASNWWSIAEINVYGPGAIPTTPLATTGWTATASVTGGANVASRGVDGNFSTRWSTGVNQASGQSYQVDMLQERTLTKVTLDASGASNDYPRAFQVFISNSTTTWGTAVASGAGTSASPSVTFPPTSGRYLKIALTAGAAAPWSISELIPYGVASSVPAATALPRTGWTATAFATCQPDTPSRALDDNASTRWSSGLPQANGQWFQIDMKTSQLISKITLDAAGSSGDYPRGYQIFASNDTSTWGAAVASSAGSGALVSISFPPVTARYVKIVQTGSASSWWSIHELNVYGVAPFILIKEGWVTNASPGASSAPNAIDGKLSTRWTTNTNQVPGQWFQFDMRATQTFNAITLNADGNTSDYPRGYQVFASNDTNNWETAIATGSGSAAMVSISFPTQTARYVKITQTGYASNFWSIAEINVYSPLTSNVDVASWVPSPITVTATNTVGGPNTGGEVTLPSATPFKIPDYIYVDTGNAGNGQSEIQFRTPAGTTVTCTYKGGARVAHPVTDLERMRGRRYRFQSCSDGTAIGAVVNVTWVRVHVTSGDASDPAGMTTVSLAGCGGCSERIPAPLAAEEIVAMRDNFTWDTIAKLPERDPDGHPALFHGLIYVENKNQLAALDRLRIMWSAQPFSERYVQSQKGRCGFIQHSTDGRGTVVYAIFLGRQFNVLRDFGIQALHANIAPPFKFILATPPDQPGFINADGSLVYATLASAGYRDWLLAHPGQAGWFDDAVDFVSDVGEDVWDYTKDTIIPTAANWGEYGFSYATNAFDQAIDWSANFLDDFWEETQQVLHNFVVLVGPKKSIPTSVTVYNRDPAFDQYHSGYGQPFFRVWGPADATGKRPKVVPAGAHVRLRQWGFGFLPIMDQQEIPESGSTVLVAAGNGDPGRGGDLCIEMDADWGMITSDFIPNEVCDFSGAHLAGSVTKFEINVSQRDLINFTQMRDSAEYYRQVIGHDPYRFEVLTDWVANELTGMFVKPKNPGDLKHRAQTLCLDFPGTGAGVLTTAITTAGLAAPVASALIGGLGLFGASLIEKDLWWPDADDTGTVQDSRAVMTHEYGHFSMCSLLFADSNAPALTGLIPRIFEGQDDSRGDVIAQATEAWADNFAIQVAGGTNYIEYPASTSGWVKFCVSGNCFDTNYAGNNEYSAADPFRDELARIQTIIYDAFDSAGSSRWGTLAPGNGDVWKILDVANSKIDPATAPFLTGADENVALSGPDWGNWARLWIARGREPTRAHFLGGLADTMYAAGSSWCDVCGVFAIHDPVMNVADRTTSYATPTPNELFKRWQACLASSEIPGWIGAPPSPFLNMNASCQQCPVHHFVVNGVCTPCSGTNVVARGDHCESCGGSVASDNETCVVP